MRKIKDFVVSAIQWIAFDGLLHIETVALILLTFTPICGFGWASLIAAVMTFGREIIQYLRKKNTKEQVHHDLICNGIGYAVGSIIIGLWHLNFYVL